MRLAEGVTAARASGLIQRHAVFPAFPATTPGKSSGIVARPPAAFGSCNAASPRSQEVWASTWPSCATSTLSHLLAVTRLWERWKARLGLSRRPPFGVDSSQSSDASSLASSFSTRWPTSLQATKTPARRRASSSASCAALRSPVGREILLRWSNGCFTLDAPAGGIDRVTAEAKAEWNGVGGGVRHRPRQAPRTMGAG
jgi:hypothetical protein